jgi:hypothetical protein
LETNFKRERGSSRHDTEIVYELLKKEVRAEEKVEYFNMD